MNENASTYLYYAFCKQSYVDEPNHSLNGDKITLKKQTSRTQSYLRYFLNEK